MRKDDDMVFVPIVLAASTNSLVRSDKNSLRISLAVVVQPVSAKIKINLSIPGLKIVTSVIKRKISGIDNTTSTILMSTESTKPLKYPLPPQ